MKEHFQNIYANHTKEYDQLVTREDYKQNLIKSIQSIRPLEGLDVVEWGAGTGRVTRLLAPWVKGVQAFDAYAPMLQIAEAKSKELGHSHTHFAVGSHHQIPLSNNVADLAIEGWSFAHLAEELSFEEGAQAVQQAIDEMVRILKPDGTIILIETQGTGRTEPMPRRDFLGKLYEYFETIGFEATWCRTDYQFTSLEEAKELIGFFFGAEMLNHLNTDELTLPECTGLWFKR